MKSLVFLIGLLISLSVQSASISIEWVCKNDANIADYSLSYGGESGVTVTLRVGKVNTFRVDTLSEGKLYWFQITPILKTGFYGKKSNFIYYRVPSKQIDESHSTPELKIKESNRNARVVE